MKKLSTHEQESFSSNIKVKAKTNSDIPAFLPQTKRFRLAIIGAFLSGLLLVIIVITLIQIPEAQRYGSLKGDMSRISKTHQRIVNNPTKIDVAFFGSSHTLNGIADNKIQVQLASRGVNVSVANLGATWMGRDLHIFLLRQLLANKHPRLIIIEVNEHEYPYGHVALPYVGSFSDLVCCRPYLDPQFPSHFALYLKQQLINSVQLLHNHKVKVISNDMSDFGWVPLNQNYTFGASKESILPRTLMKHLKFRFYSMISSYGLGIVDDMVKLAHANGVKVAFLYLPEYENVKKPLILIGSYTKLAPIIKIPEYFGDNPMFWNDEAHLNQTGSLALAPILANDIQKLLSSSN